MIKYFELNRQYKQIGKKIPVKVNKILGSGRYILGHEVEQFEKKFAQYCGVKYAVGVASGTDALILGLKAVGIRPGDEVIVPSFTFIASVFSIIHAGAKPVFVEVNPQTYTLDPNSIEKMISRKTKAILPVHLYGQPASMSQIKKIAKRHKLKIVEDCAQAHGAKFEKNRVGSIGDLGCFSFYPTKNLGAFGDGGIITTNQRSLAEKARKLRNLGRVNMKDIFKCHDELGTTSRLDAIQAGILNIKIKYLDGFNQKRRAIAKAYHHGLRHTPLILPEEEGRGYHVYHLFVVRVPGKKRASLRNYLQKRGIATMIHYPTPAHRQPPCRRERFRRGKLPMTEKIASEIVSLPMYPEMKISEVRKVCREINNFYARKKHKAN